jgi:hypothetical protein
LSIFSLNCPRNVLCSLNNSLSIDKLFTICWLFTIALKCPYLLLSLTICHLPFQLLEVDGKIIIRFKYLLRNKSLPAEEKVVNYHLMDFDKKKVLGVYIEGDNEFSMYKLWGEGDERLLPIHAEYKDTIIRWGKQEAEQAANNKNKGDDQREFIY